MGSLFICPLVLSLLVRISLMIVRNLKTLLITALLLFCAQVMAESNSTYKLASGDVIRINVFGEPDLSFEEIRLNDAGIFSYPFIGDVRARGKTAAEIESHIAKQLKDGYLVNPRVSISVLQYREFYISGEVQKPGGYPFQPGLTVRRAAALGGGLTERASTSRITIIRDQDPKRHPEPASLDTLVMPGDTITIDQGFF